MTNLLRVIESLSINLILFVNFMHTLFHIRSFRCLIFVSFRLGPLQELNANSICWLDEFVGCTLPRLRLTCCNFLSEVAWLMMLIQNYISFSHCTSGRLFVILISSWCFNLLLLRLLGLLDRLFDLNACFGCFRLLHRICCFGCCIFWVDNSKYLWFNVLSNMLHCLFNLFYLHAHLHCLHSVYSFCLIFSHVECVFQ